MTPITRWCAALYLWCVQNCCVFRAHIWISDKDRSFPANLLADVRYCERHAHAWGRDQYRFHTMYASQLWYSFRMEEECACVRRLINNSAIRSAFDVGHLVFEPMIRATVNGERVWRLLSNGTPFSLYAMRGRTNCEILVPLESRRNPNPLPKIKKIKNKWNKMWDLGLTEWDF